MVSNAVKISDEGEGKEEAKTDDDDLQMVIMGYPKGFDQKEFDRLFIRKDGLPHLLLSDVDRIAQQMQSEYPEIVKIESIGRTWQDRPMNMIKINAKEYLEKKEQSGADKP